MTPTKKDTTPTDLCRFYFGTTDVAELNALWFAHRAASSHLEAEQERIAGIEAVLAEMVAASDEVNARYIGGSDPDSPRFSATMDRLALATLNLRIALRGSPDTETTEGGTDG